MTGGAGCWSAIALFVSFLDAVTADPGGDEAQGARGLETGSKVGYSVANICNGGGGKVVGNCIVEGVHEVLALTIAVGGAGTTVGCAAGRGTIVLGAECVADFVGYYFPFYGDDGGDAGAAYCLAALRCCCC